MPWAIGQTIVSGSIISKNTRWTKENSPYQISGATSVVAGAVLTIEAGVVVNFISPLGIVVSGRIEAVGTAGDSVYFNTIIPTVGKANFKSFILQEKGSLSLRYVSQRGGYNGQRGSYYFVSTEKNVGNIDLLDSRFAGNEYIFFGKGGDNRLMANNTVFELSKFAIANIGVQANNCRFDSLQNVALFQIGFGAIEKCKFTKIDGRAIEVNAPVNINDCDFEYNRTAIFTQSINEKFVITASRFSHNNVAIEFTGSASIYDTIYNNTFCANASFDVENNIINNVKLNLSNNCWCETDTAKILAKINAPNQAVVFPLHISCRPCVAKIQKDTGSVCTDSTARLVGVAEPDMICAWSPNENIQLPNRSSALFVAKNEVENIVYKQFIYTISNPITGCTSSDSIIKMILPRTHPKCRNCKIELLKKNIEICAERPIGIGFENENIFWKYQWSPQQLLDNEKGFNPNLISVNTTTESKLLKYKVQIIDSAAGCSATDSVLITILPKYAINCNPRPELHVYNIVTPNNDDKNATLYIENWEYYSPISLTIFNKWGMKIYHTNNYQNDWAAEGQLDGTYYYHLVIYNQDQKLEKRDHFVITGNQ